MFFKYHSIGFTLFVFFGCVTIGYCFPYPSTYEVLRRKHSIQQLTAPLQHAEGPFWYAEKQLLYFVDISGFKVYQYDPHTKQLTFAEIGTFVGMVIPIAGSDNKFIIGKGTTLAVMTWNGQNTTRPLIENIDTVDLDKPGNRFNDGKSDRTGRLWIGTMGLEEPVGVIEPKKGTLFRLSNTTCKLEPVITGVSISNGIAWSLDNRFMYYIDSPTRRVERFNYNIINGEISNRQTVIDFEKSKLPGVPDGMTIDNYGNLWIACWGGSQVINVDGTTGKILYAITLPVERVTSVTFGGKHFDTLYVTTMKKGLSPEELKKQPAAGAVFSISNLSVNGHYNSPVYSRCVNSHQIRRM